LPLRLHLKKKQIPQKTHCGLAIYITKYLIKTKEEL
jgi:hypothetical protein